MRVGTPFGRVLWLSDDAAAWDAALAVYDRCVEAKSEHIIAANAKKRAKRKKGTLSAAPVASKTLVELDTWWRSELPSVISMRAERVEDVGKRGKEKTAPKKKWKRETMQ